MARQDVGQLRQSRALRKLLRLPVGPGAAIAPWMLRLRRVASKSALYFFVQARRTRGPSQPFSTFQTWDLRPLHTTRCTSFLSSSFDCCGRCLSALRVSRAPRLSRTSLAQRLLSPLGGSKRQGTALFRSSRRARSAILPLIRRHSRRLTGCTSFCARAKLYLQTDFPTRSSKFLMHLGHVDQLLFWPRR